MGSGVGFALMLTTLAGLSTAIGGLVGIFVRKPGRKRLTDQGPHRLLAQNFPFLLIMKTR